MGKRGHRLPLCAAGFILLLSFPIASYGQVALGQYEDEAPLRSWNILGTDSASTLGLGGTRFAGARESSAASANPALLASLPEYSLTLTGSFVSATLFKYSLVNTGVVTTRGNVRATFFGLNTGSVSFRLGGWALAISSSILENFGRPAIFYEYSSGGTVYYSLDMKQEGFLRGYQLALARKLSPKFSVGLGVNYARGRLSRLIDEQTPVSEITITDDKSETFKGLYFNAGIRGEFSPELAAAVVIRTPYIRKSDARSRLWYLAPREDTDIRIDADAVNEYRQPWVVGAGVSYRLSGNLTAAADLTYFGWSRYSVLYFEEPLDRPFRDILQLSGGIEYNLPSPVRSRILRIPIRVGFTFDPQPTRQPTSTYYYVAFGTGVDFDKLALDVGSRYGWESGSGDQLNAFEVAVTVRYHYGR